MLLIHLSIIQRQYLHNRVSDGCNLLYSDNARQALIGRQLGLQLLLISKTPFLSSLPEILWPKIVNIRCSNGILLGLLLFHRDDHLLSYQ